MVMLAQQPATSTTPPATGAAPIATPAPAGPTAQEQMTGTVTTTTGGAATPPPPAGQSPSPGGFGLIPIIVLMFGFMILMQVMSGRKEKKKRQALMNAMGKGDTVVTIGGQIGVVDQIRDNEVVLRIDQNSNAKARFTKASIQTVMESAGRTEPDGAETAGGNGTIEVKAKGDKALAGR